METMNKVTEVRDSYFVSYGVFYSMGVLTFVPYFFFIIATDVFQVVNAGQSISPFLQQTSKNYYKFFLCNLLRGLIYLPDITKPCSGGYKNTDKPCSLLITGATMYVVFGNISVRRDYYYKIYWMFKFRDPSRGPSQPGRPTPPEIPPPDDFDEFAFRIEGADDSIPAKERTQLQASFTSSFFITYQVSLLGFLVVTALFRKKLPPPSKRIKGALFSMLVLFLIHTAFTKINTDSFQELFFAVTMVLAVLLNLSTAIIMVSLFELVLNFPIGYYGTILSGQAISGVVSALLQICVLSMRTNYLTSGLIFFGVGSAIILSTTIFYLITKKKSKYFIYRIGQYEGTTQEPVAAKCSFNMDQLRAALQRTKWFLGAMVFVQGSTAMVHPGLTALIVSMERDSGGGDQWNEIFFVPVVTFLGFNACDLIGREAARKIQRPTNAFVILTLASLRLILVPLLMLCNAQPRRNMPVIFGDNQYMILVYLFGLTQGYLINLCIISVPRVARKEELEFVIVLLPLFSILSVAICSAFNLVMISLI